MNKDILTCYKDFNYDEVLKLPSKPSPPKNPPPPPLPIDEVVSTAPDPLADLKEILISDQGMKIDRNLYRSFKKRVTEDAIIKDLVSQQNFDEAETYLKNKVLTLRKSEQVKFSFFFGVI